MANMDDGIENRMPSGFDAEPISLDVTMDHIDALDAWWEMVDQRTVEIEFTCADEAGNPSPTTFRGAMVEADGLTWWERKIRELEADGRGNSKGEVAALPGEDISIESCLFSVRVRNVLHTAGIRTIADLYRVPKLSRVKYLGWKGLTEIRDVLNELNLPPIPNLRIRRPNQPKEAKGKS